MFFPDWDEEEHKRLVEMDEESMFDFHPPDHTKDSGYGNAERSYRSQEVLFATLIYSFTAEHNDAWNMNVSFALLKLMVFQTF